MHGDPSPRACGDAVRFAQSRRHGVFVPFWARSHELETFGQFGPITPGAVERRTESTCPAVGVEHPLSELKGWAVTNVLTVTTRKFGHPVASFVEVIAVISRRMSPA